MKFEFYCDNYKWDNNACYLCEELYKQLNFDYTKNYCYEDD